MRGTWHKTMEVSELTQFLFGNHQLTVLVITCGDWASSITPIFLTKYSSAHVNNITYYYMLHQILHILYDANILLKRMKRLLED